MSGFGKRKAVSAARITGWRFNKRPRLAALTNPVRALARRAPYTRRKFAPKNNAIIAQKLLKNVGPAYMPPMFMTKLVWVENNRTLAIGGAVDGGEYIYRGNSIYDPDYTGAGRTAAGHTELATIYSYYKVIGSRITVKCTPGTLTNTARLVVYPYRSGATSTTAAEINVVPNQVSTDITSDPVTKKVTSYCRSNILFGTRGLDEDSYSAQMSANPNHGWFWHVALAGTASDSCMITVQIEYYTVFFNLLKTYGASI